MKITKTSVYLVIILIIALVLRLIAAHHTHVSTDEMIYSIIPFNIISSGQLGTIEQSPLFFYLTDLGYRFFSGITAISVRFFSVIFGSLAVLVVYLFSREIWYDKKAGLLAGLLFALSGYTLLNNTEMDMIAFFFSLLSMLFFIYYLKRNTNRHFYFSVVFLILAVLVKNIVLLFFPAYALIFLIYFKNKNYFDHQKLTKKITKILLVGIILSLILISPILIYNYFTYQELGTTDYYFSQMLGIGETVHLGLEGKPWELQKVFSIFKLMFLTFLKTDTFILFGGLLGIFLFFRKNDKHNNLVASRSAVYLLILSTVFLFGYLMGQTGSSSHYLWIPLVLSIFAGGCWVRIAEKFKSLFKFKSKFFIFLIIFIAVLISIFIMQDLVNSRKESITLSLRDYVHENIPDDAVVVIDPRIYRGIHAWVFNDKHYLDGTNFASLVQQLTDLDGIIKEVPVFYVECVEGTYCGWKPEDFERIYDAGEEISLFFKERTELVKEIRAGHNFNVYQGSLELPTGAYEVIDKSHQFWFYPVGWKYPEQAVDYYETEGFGKVIEKIGFILLWLNVILALLTIPFVLYLGLRKERNINL